MATANFGIVQGGFDWQVAPYFVVGVGADLDIRGRSRRQRSTAFRRRVSGFDHHFDHNINEHGRRLWPRRLRAASQSVWSIGLVGWSWPILRAISGSGTKSGEALFQQRRQFNANGLTFGGGVEWRFTENVSLRAEYRFTDLDNFDNNGRFDREGDVWMCASSGHATISISMSSACCSPSTGALVALEQLQHAAY